MFFLKITINNNSVFGIIDLLTYEEHNMHFQILLDRVGEYRWQLKGPNNEVIALSKGYVSKYSCLDSLKMAQKANGKTPIKGC